MKVDKSVCTGNDAYFAGGTAPNELNSIIKFETVFTTLVENKILAIKRDCELHENKKKSRSLKSCLTKKPDGTSCDGENQQQTAENGVESKKPSRKNFFLRHKNKQSEVDVEKGEKRDKDEPAELKKTRNEPDLAANGNEPSNVDSQTNEPLATSVELLVTQRIDGQRNCDTLIVNSEAENAQLTQISTNDSTSDHSIKTVRESSPPALGNNEGSLATTVDLSLQELSSVVKAMPIDKQPQVVHDKSDVAICDDGASSQNTSDIEFSLVSESMSELPHGIRKKTTNSSDPIIKKPVHFLTPQLGREVKVTERKAISCQSTPLFGRQQKAQVKVESEVKKVLTFQKELPKKTSEVKPIEKAKSQTIVIAPTSTTTTTTLAKPSSTGASGPMESVHVSRKSQKHSRYRDVSVEYEISYDDDDGKESPHGFISSFNQLTSQMQPGAVITTSNHKKHSRQSKKDGRYQQETVEEKAARHHEIELELDELAIDVVNKKKRRRSKKCFGVSAVSF